LHQTIAAVAYKRAAATGELAAATDRHTTFYLGLLRMQQQEWRTLVAEWPQVRHAWQVVSAGSDREKIVGYALAAVLVQLKLGLYSEMLVWCRRGLEVEDLDDYHRGSLLNFAGRAAYAMGDKRTALHYYQQAMAVLEVAGDLSGQATMFNNLGLTYADGGEYDLAVKNYELAATMHHEGGNRDGEATALNNLASIAFQRSDQATAHAYWEQALELSKEANNLDLQAQILNNIGGLYQAARQFQLAAQNYQAALTIYEATGNQADAALPQHNLAVLQAIVTGGTESRAELEQILAGYQARGDRSNQALALHNLAYYHSWQGERKLAFRLHNEALTIRRSLADPAAEADSLSSIGKLYADGDEHKQAILHYKEALRIRTRLGRLNDQALTLHNMSLSQYRLGEKLEALKNLQRASSLAKKGNDVALQGSIFNTLGMVVDSQHRPSVAMRYYNQALILVREVDDQKEEAAILFNQGKVYFDSRNLDEAGLCFRAALTLAEKFNLTFLIESAKDGLGRIAKAQPSQELYAPASLTRKDQHKLLNSQFVQP